LYLIQARRAATQDSDDDVEVIMNKGTGNTQTRADNAAADEVCSETFICSLVHVLSKTFAKMQVDDEAKPSHDIGTVPKGLSFKKHKVNHECTHQDHPEAACPSTQVRILMFILQ
jgi:hypothetical protein